MELVTVYSEEVEDAIKNVDVLIESATEYLVNLSRDYSREQAARILREDKALQDLTALKTKIYALSIPRLFFVRYNK